MTTASRLPAPISLEARVYVRPLAPLRGADAIRAIAAGAALPLCGAGLAFGFCEIIVRTTGTADPERYLVPVASLSPWIESLDEGAGRSVQGVLDRLSVPRPPLAARPPEAPLGFERPLIMSILNVTPDSFTGDGVFRRPADAIARGFEMVEEGADIIDVGGESTRPGAEPVAIGEELERVIPVIEGLRDCGRPISIDSRNSGVLDAAMAAGASILNDISALTHDSGSMAVAANSDAPVVLMHCQGTPDMMSRDPRYDDVVLDVFDYLDGAVQAAVEGGVGKDRIIVDPGIGFGKTGGHNFELLQGLSVLHGLGCPVLLGTSRKRFVGDGQGPAQGREGLSGSLASALAGLAQGANILRVHDVKETVRAVRVWISATGGV